MAESSLRGSICSGNNGSEYDLPPARESTEVGSDCDCAASSGAPSTYQNMRVHHVCKTGEGGSSGVQESAV